MPSPPHSGAVAAGCPLAPRGAAPDLHPPPRPASPAPSSSAADDDALLGSPPSSAAGPSPPPTPPPPAPPPRRHRAATAAAVTAVAAVLAADQQLMAPNLSAIAADLGLPPGDRDRLLGGVVAALFFAVGAPAALAAGYASARWDRVRLLAFLVLLGEAPCLATAWVTTYGGLLATRVLTGASAGGLPPLLYSLLGDLVGPRHRAAASTGVQLAVSGGAAAGQLLAGVMGPRLGWRSPFPAVAVPALVAAALLVAFVSDPPRGGMDGDGGGAAGVVVVAATGAVPPPPAPPPPPPCPPAPRLTRARRAAAAAAATAASVFATPSAAAVILQGAPGSLPWGVFGTFMTDFLHVDRGLGLGRASGLLAAWGVGGAVGVVCGGLTGQALHNAGKEGRVRCSRRRGQHAWPLGRGAMPAAAGLAVAAATGPALFLVRTATGATPWPALAAVAAVGGVASCAAGPAIRATLLNVTSPANRGVALALQTILDDVGRGAGPFLVSRMTGAWGRPRAFTVAVSMWAPCGGLIACAGWTLARDEDRASDQAAASAAAATSCCAMVAGTKRRASADEQQEAGGV